MSDLVRTITFIVDWIVLTRLATIKKFLTNNNVPKAIHVIENTLSMIANKVESPIEETVLNAMMEQLEMALYMCLLNAHTGAIQFIDEASLIIKHNIHPDHRYVMQSRLKNSKDEANVGTLASLPDDILWNISLLLTV